jgi:hypothetical protein
VVVPDGTASWRICRQTTGRPREIVGPDKQPIRFALDTTSEQLADLCGAGTYRVYALDDVGELIDHVTTLDLTGDAVEPRNAASPPMMARPSIALPINAPTTGSAPTTDLRFALETMSYMMRTNADALRIVAASQVDLAKSIAASKGIPLLRNAALYVPDENDDDADDPDDEADEAEYTDRPKTWIDVAAPLIEQFAPAVPSLLALLPQKAGATAERNSSEAATEGADGLTAEEVELARAPAWEAREFLDLRYAQRKGNARRKAKALRARNAKTAPTPPTDMQSVVMSDPVLMRKVVAIKAQLTAEEGQLVLDAIAESPPAEQLNFLNKLKTAPEEAGLAACRELLSLIRAAAATTNAPLPPTP